MQGSLFIYMNFSNVHFVKSITDLKFRPEPLLPEIAVVGRSNVGKSSLINTIFNRRNLAKISSKPGKTRLINYFNIDDTLYLVDLPGYGFARIPKTEKQKWRQMLENYLSKSGLIRTIWVLVDSRRGLQDLDRQMIAWLQHHLAPFDIVLTKCDKISRTQLRQCALQVEQEVPQVKIYRFSAKTRLGKTDLLKALEIPSTDSP